MIVCPGHLQRNGSKACSKAVLREAEALEGVVIAKPSR
jgi:hypothetical protein